jgi:hypothetical protein
VDCALGMAYRTDVRLSLDGCIYEFVYVDKKSPFVSSAIWSFHFFCIVSFKPKLVAAPEMNTKQTLTNSFMLGLGYDVLTFTPCSTIFQLYNGGQFSWCAQRKQPTCR